MSVHALLKTRTPASTYTVTFNMNGHGEDIAPVFVAAGGTITEPPAPTAQGYTFGGWYTEAACTTAYDFNTPITGDITLYAKWTLHYTMDAAGNMVVYTPTGVTLWEEQGVAKADIKTLVVKNTVTEISDESFKECANLKSATFKGGIIVQGQAFENCPALETVIFEDTSYIGGYAFYHSTALKTLTFAKATNISGSAFYCNASDYKNNALTEVVFPDGSDIKNASLLFENYQALKNVTFNGGIIVQGTAFENCPALESVTFKDNATVSEDAFKNCPALANVTFKKNADLSKNTFGNYSWNNGTIVYSVADNTMTITFETETAPNFPAQVFGLLDHAKTTIDANCFYRVALVDTTKDEGCHANSEFVDCVTGEHSFTNYVSNNDATCVADGTKTAVCDNGCGATDLVADTGSALGHSFTNYTPVTAATCTTDGSESATCANGCGATDTRTIPAAHAWGEWTKTSTQHQRVCANDATHVESGNHTFSGNTCTVCGYHKPSFGGFAYAVTVGESENGSISADKQTAFADETVKLTVTPDKGYTLETVTVTDKNGNEISLTATEVGKTYTFKMPARAVEVKATFMEDNTMLNYFVDVTAEDYYYDAVLWATENGITGGVDAIHFNPNGICTRAQAVTFLWRAAGCPEVAVGETFSDVVKGSYYEKAVAWAIAEGITKGTTPTTFSPNATCTRGQIMTFLYRANKMDTLNIKNNSFTDVMDGAYYCDAVLWAVERGITNGTTATTFSPNDGCTRAQIVTFLYRSITQ